MSLLLLLLQRHLPKLVIVPHRGLLKTPDLVQDLEF